MYLFGFVLLHRKSIYHCMWSATVCKSCPMGCPSVCGDNPRVLASGLSYVHVDKHGIATYINEDGKGGIRDVFCERRI